MKGFVSKNTERANTWAKNLFRALLEARNKRRAQDAGLLDVLVTGSDGELGSKGNIEERGARPRNTVPAPCFASWSAMLFSCSNCIRMLVPYNSVGRPYVEARAALYGAKRTETSRSRR